MIGFVSVIDIRRQSVMPQLTPKAAVVVDVMEIYITSPGPDAGKLVS